MINVSINLRRQPGSYHDMDARAQWEARANRRIEFAPGDSMDRDAIVSRNEYITAAYAEMYLRDPQVYKWAGMAALTSAAVGRGMYMMHCLKQTHLAGIVGLFSGEVGEILYTLGLGNIAVFRDIYWQHMAYDQGGLDELEAIFRAGRLDPSVMQAWRQIDAGKRTGDQELIWQGNTGLLYFEQKEVLQGEVYDRNRSLWKEVCGWIASPIPGHHETFEAFSPRGNIGVFEDRWQWIERSMLPCWKALADTQPQRVERALHAYVVTGRPFAVPGLTLGKPGRRLYQAAGVQTGMSIWLPKVTINRKGLAA